MITATTRITSATIGARPRRPPVIRPTQSRQERRISCRASQTKECGPDHAASACSATRVRNMSSRLVPLRPARWRSSSSVPSAMSRPRGDDADPLGHALRHFEDVRRHHHGVAGAHAGEQHVLHLPRRAGVEPGQRLVEDDQPRVVHQRAGERHLLAHALRHAFAALVRLRHQAEPAEQILGAGVGQGGRRCPTGRRRIPDIRTASACRRSSARPRPRP